MTGPAREGKADRARQEAADWFARLRADPDEGERAAFEAWRARDPLNGEAYDRLFRKWEQSRFLANIGLGKGRDLSRARAWHRHPSVRYAAVAATLVLVLCGTLLLLRPTAPPTTPFDYASRGDGIRRLSLADGSRVTLDRDSALRVTYSASERRLDLLKGRARFDVALDAARPFVVGADGGVVVAHGTVFDVALRPTLVRVVLLRGSVEVRGDGTAPGGRASSRMLAAGQAVTLRHGKLPSPPMPADPAEARWPEGMVSFNGTPLRDAVAGFNRRNAVKLALASERIGDLPVTGAFAADDPGGFARAAGEMFRLEVHRGPGGAVMLQSPATRKP